MSAGVSVAVSISRPTISGGRAAGFALGVSPPLGILQKTGDEAMWSENDRIRMEKQWHFRLREVLGEPEITLYFDAEFTLHLICNTPGQVERLLIDPDDLKHEVWLVCGCESIALWFAQERVWSTNDTDSGIDMLFTPDELELIQFEADLSEECGMATATIDRMAADVAKQTLPGVVSEIVAAEMKAAVEGNVQEQVKAFLTSSEFIEMVRGEVRSQLQPLTASNGNGAATVPAQEPATAAPVPAAKRTRQPAKKTAAKSRTGTKTRRTTKAKTDA